MQLETLVIPWAENQKVDALFACPKDAKACFVFAHGAGAGMRHGFMTSCSQMFFSLGIATLRFQFPYMQAQKRRPDRQEKLVECIDAAVKTANHHVGHLPLFAGGKSMGGRMMSWWQCQQKTSMIKGLIFLGFPLHPPEKPSKDRAAHLSQVTCPMLFIQGERDKLADLSLLGSVLSPLSQASLHVIADGDHSFHVRKTKGFNPDTTLPNIIHKTATWMDEVLGNTHA